MSADKCEGTPVTWAEIIEGTRAERLRSFCADPTGHVLKEMQTNGNFSSTGSLIQNLNEQNTKLRADLEQSRAAFEEVNGQLLRSNAELAAAKRDFEELKDVRRQELFAISDVLCTTGKPAPKSERLDPGDSCWTPTYSHACAAVDREIEHREARYAAERELEGWCHVSAMERKTAANEAKQRASQQTLDQKRDEIDVEDHRVANAVRAREEEILKYIHQEHKAYAKFAEPPKTWFRRFFGPHEWEVRGDSFCRALRHVGKFIRKEHADPVLDNMRFNP